MKNDTVPPALGPTARGQCPSCRTRSRITASSFISTSKIAVRMSPFSLAVFVASMPSVLTLTFDLLWVWPPFFLGFVITVTLHVESTHKLRCPNITKASNENLQDAIREVSKGNCIAMAYFNHGNIQLYNGIHYSAQGLKINN